MKCRTDDSIVGVESNFICETTQAVAKGAELITTYMSDPLSRSNSRYLIDYGFVPEVNPDNSALIRLARFKDVARPKLEALFYHKLAERLPFPCVMPRVLRS